MNNISVDSTQTARNFKPTVNFVVEDMFYFKYIGCTTAAKSLYRQINTSQAWNAMWNGENTAPISHYHTFGPLALYALHQSTGINILTAHSTPRVNVGNIAGTNIINKIYPYIYKKFDHIITISQTCEDEIKELIPDAAVTRIPNGVDRERFKRDKEAGQTFRQKHGIAEDETVVLNVAQLSPRKGIYDFLEIAKQCPHTKFVWVGGFPYGVFSTEFLSVKHALRSAPKNVICTGFVPDVLHAYSAADIFLMPSHAETFGLVILEALSCELPVIARNITEFQEIYGSSISLFSTINEACNAVSDEKGLSVLQSSARGATEPYDIINVAKQTTDLYTKLLESR
ncbi:MAG: glycosyltransferase family 4 protein [Methanomicrobiales archaeon]|jgi:glycosyltransferase involved in cell wall biosynthesis|nr:glycosyltransferase family 4 protein [Methanomicrobiales archaeon]